MKLGIRTGNFFVAALLVLVLVFVLFSCGKGKSRTSGAAVTGMAGRDARPTDRKDGHAPRAPTPNRELSLAEVIAEVEAYEPPGDVDISIFDELRLELIRAFEEVGADSFPIRTPSAEGDSGVSISDIFVQPLQDGGNAIRWNEILEGDLNGDGEVTIADVSPIARNYLDVYGDGDGDVEDWFITRAAGGDDEITIADVAVIARNYLMTGPTGYDVWRVPMGGGAAERIENAGDPGAPTVAKGDAMRTGDAPARFGLEGGGSLPSSLRFVSQEGDDETWSNGAYYYVIDERDEGGAPPDEPGERKFNILVKYDTPFRVKVGGVIKAIVTVFGDVTPVEYAINWGDGTVEPASTNEKQAIFTHAYDTEGVYAPYVAVSAEVEGGGQTLVQDAPVIYVRPDFPFAPTSISVDSLENGNAYLVWEPPVDWTPSDTYSVYWSLRKGASRPELLVEGLTGNTYVDEAVSPTIAPGISVYYKVTAVRGGLESPFSTEYEWPDIAVAPEPPVNLGAEAGNNLVKVTWEASPSTNVDGYRVFYETVEDGSDQITAADTSESAREQTVYDTPEHPVENGTTYYFWVSATRGGLESVQAGPIAAVPGNVKPVASFTSVPPLPYTGNPGDAVNFTSTSSDTDGDIVYYAWDFDGDGTPDNSGAGLSSVEHTYNEEGNFQPSLTVTDDDGASDTFTSGSVSIGTGLPVAVANADPTGGNPPLTVDFSATGSEDLDGMITEYAWKFFSNDIYRDYTAEGGDASFEYTEPGTYMASLRVTDNDGKKAYDSVEIIVNESPTALANAAPTFGNVPLEVNFDASGSFDPDDGIVLWQWDWDSDGTYEYSDAATGNTTHTYTDPGDFTAVLRVIDSYAATATDSIAIYVNAPPAAVANADDPDGTKPHTVNFNANGSTDPDGEIVKWEWDFDGDGTYDWESGTSGTTSHMYTDHGDFTAKLRVTDDDGAWDTDTVAIHVNAAPIASLTADPTEGNPPLTVNFDASGSSDPFGNIVKYEWDWEGDGTYDFDSETDPTVEYTYNDPGSYNATVRVTDNDGEGDTESAEITIIAKTWHIETVDSEGYVGTYTSIALDSSDNPHISYNDNSNGDLKYAYYNGTSWQIETVDSEGGVGRWTAIALSSTDNPHISYQHVTNRDLKYAYYDGTSWQIETVDSGGWEGEFSSIALSSSDIPHISYNDGTNNALKYAYYDGASWQIEIVDSGGDVGRDTSIALSSSDKPHISYNYGTNEDLKYAYYNGSSWQIETVDSGGNVGQETSIALDSSDNPHISYKDETNSDLKYAYYDGASWQTETVDSAGGVGWYSSIAVDSSGNPHISYYYGTSFDLKYAYYNGSSWQIKTVDSGGEVGSWTSIALDSSGNPHISYEDWTNSALKYAYYK